MAQFSDAQSGAGTVVIDTSGSVTADAGGPYDVRSGFIAVVGLDGSGSSATRTSIQTYDWQIKSGPGRIFGSGNEASLYVGTNLQSGETIVVELTVTGVQGAQDTDIATITVTS